MSTTVKQVRTKLVAEAWERLAPHLTAPEQPDAAEIRDALSETLPILPLTDEQVEAMISAADELRALRDAPAAVVEAAERSIRQDLHIAGREFQLLQDLRTKLAEFEADLQAEQKAATHAHNAHMNALEQVKRLNVVRARYPYLAAPATFPCPLTREGLAWYQAREDEIGDDDIPEGWTRELVAKAIRNVLGDMA